MAYEEYLLIKHYETEHLILLKIENMMDIKEVLFQWFINFLIKRFLPAVLKMRIFLVNSTRITQTNY